MAISGIAAKPQAPQAAQPLSHPRRGGTQTPSISDVDAQNSSAASTHRATGRVGGKVDISV
jgi:hypothetical protein